MTQLAERHHEEAPFQAPYSQATRTVLMRRYLEHHVSQATTASGQLSRLRTRFERLAETWVEETGLLSSTTEMIAHWAYQEIVALGGVAVPLLLEEMAEEPDHWGPALEILTGENPVPDEHLGDVDAMAEDWVSWGKARGFLR